MINISNTLKYSKYSVSPFLIFAILLIGRLLIAGTGCLDDTDEFTYFNIIKDYKLLIRLDIERWGKTVFGDDGNPPEIALRLLQTFFVLAYSRLTGAPQLHPESLYIMYLFNIITSLLILFVFYRILLLLEFKHLTSLLGVTLLGTLVNTNIYIRHILPYDSGLLFQLTALAILLSKDITNKKILLAGVFSAIGLTNYVGYFMFVFINHGFLVLNHSKSFKYAIIKSIVFFIPLVLVVLIFEACAQSIGKSYIEYIIWFSTTIYHGSYSEGLSYIFIYFNLVEKWWGVVLLILFFTGALLAIRSQINEKVKYLLCLSITAYLIYGSYIYFFEKMVFYGRVLHMYYPFIILGVLCFFEQQKLINSKIIAILLIVLSFINYIFIINDLNNIGYPRSYIYSKKLTEEEGKVRISYQNELNCGIDYKERKLMRMENISSSGLDNGEYLLLNFCFFYHYPDDFIETYNKYTIGKNDIVVYEKNHFMSHPAYTFEYCTKQGRDFYLDKQLKLKVIKLQ